MGNLLKVLTCTDLEQEPNFFLDFESKLHTIHLFSLLVYTTHIIHQLLRVGANKCFHLRTLKDNFFVFKHPYLFKTLLKAGW